MFEFPSSSEETCQLAIDLVKYLKNVRKNTETATGWTRENINRLDEYFSDRGLDCFHSRSEKGGEFLWDFAAYARARGILLVAESEHANAGRELERDFEKLFYATSPLKLFMCRVNGPENAKKLKDSLSAFMHATCKNFNHGEVFILYFVWWAGSDNINRDIAYLLQVSGKLAYSDIDNAEFTSI